MKCSKCNYEFVPEDKQVEQDGAVYCQDCFDDTFSQCAHCEEYFNKDELEHIESTNKDVCEDCLEDRYIECKDCDQLYLRIDSIRVRSYGQICQSCYDASYFTCDSCDRVLSNDNYGHDGNCVNCTEEAEAEEEPDNRRSKHVYGYHDFGADIVFHPALVHVSDRRYGVELEVEADNSEIADSIYSYSASNKLFHMETDGSLLKDTSFEIITQPCSVQYHLATFPWESILKTLREAGAKSHNTSTCGLHIHVNKSALTYTEQVKVGIFIHLNIGKVETLSRRNASNYCLKKPIKNTAGKIRCPNKNYDAEGKYLSRYEAVNYTNYSTIEFRSFRGTLKLETLLATIEFVDSVCAYCKLSNVQETVNGNWIAYRTWLNSQKYTYLISYLNSKLI